MKSANTLFNSALFSLSLLFTSLAQAAPVTFNFTFDDPGSSALTVGSITFEDTLVANPGQNFFQLPNAAVLALTVTVSGASSGNGTFGINNFGAVLFETNGGTLNFAAELVGQPTNGLPWGTQIADQPTKGFVPGDAGDFNLFSNVGQLGKTGAERYQNRVTPQGVGPFPPDGVFFFLLGADGGMAEAMALTSMAPAGVGGAIPVPTLSFWASLILCLGLAGFAISRGALKPKRASRN